MSWNDTQAEQKVTALYSVFASAIRPPKRLTVSEWSDGNRYLTPEGSSEPGRWRTARFPFLRRIMDLLSPQCPTQRVTVMKGAQLGFTEAGLNLVLYTVDHAPAPILFVQKTVENVERLSKQRLEKSIRLTPSLVGKIGIAKSRDSSNTIRLKSFPGGILILGGANSAASLRSMPIQILILDEEDSYDSDVGEEGDPSELAIARTRNFPRRKIFRLSTPAIRETSKIEPNYEEGSRERYHVQCPYCGRLQVIYWSQMKWEGDDPDTIQLECLRCKKLISERFKTQMLRECENYDDPDAPGARWIAENPDAKDKSFHISGLYSPLGFFSWKDAAAMFIKATRTFDKDLLKVYVNTVLGETWTETGKTIEAHWVEKRKEDYAAELPSGVLVVTIGCDVQEDRIEAETVGWGLHMESWSIDYAVFMGDTEHEAVWEQLDGYIQRMWKHTSGALVTPAVVAVDSGHRAQAVYRFCRKREFLRVFPVKGEDGFGKGYIRKPKARNDFGVWLFLAYVDEIKSRVYSQLQIAERGPGFCHFPRKPIYDSAYFRGLTAETLKTAKKGGRRVLRWELPKGRRNEQLDCRGYAMAALSILNPNMERLAERGRPLILSGRKIERKRVRRRRVVSAGVS